MERDGERWREMERDGEGWRGMERDGESAARVDRAMPAYVAPAVVVGGPGVVNLPRRPQRDDRAARLGAVPLPAGPELDRLGQDLRGLAFRHLERHVGVGVAEVRVCPGRGPAAQLI